MKKSVVLLLTMFCLNAFAQTLPCKADTFDVIMAYETGGQFALGDQIIKPAGFVLFDGQVSLQNYKRSYFELPDQWGSGAAFRKLKTCGLNVNADSFLQWAAARLDTLSTKTWVTVNKTYAGKGETMTGTNVNMPELEFNYKIVHVKCIAVYMGDSPKTLINMDRKHKKERQLVDITCPQYIITNIIDLKPLPQK